jgi:hypothetical protein
LTKGRHVTAKSNAIMETHFMIFVTVGNLVSPSSFPFAGEVRGRTLGRPPNEKTYRL